MKKLCWFAVLSVGLLAARGDDEWEKVKKCVEENVPGYWDRLDREYKPHVCPAVVTNGLDSFVESLTNIQHHIDEVGQRTWALNAPISRQIDFMLEWAVWEAIDETLDWIKTTNGAAYLSSTNSLGQWVSVLEMRRDIVDKVTADKRAMVSSINWPVIYTNAPPALHSHEVSPRSFGMLAPVCDCGAYYADNGWIGGSSTNESR